MKKIFLLSVLSVFLVLTLCGQTWLQPHTNIGLSNKPGEAKLSDLISANGSNSIGMSSMPGAGTIKTMRNFHQMEIDYKYNFFPSDGILNPDTCSCANVWCNGGSCTDIMQPGTKSGFESHKGFYCAWNTSNYGFKEMYAALESIFPKYNGACPNTTINRGYPNKWYSLTEFGGLNNAAVNFKNYVTAFLMTNCPKNLAQPALVNVLEIGNEPWGDPYPGKDGYHQLLIGAVSACRNYYGSSNPNNWRIQLSLAAFRAHSTGAGPFGEQFYYVDDAIPDSLKKYFNYVEIHPYAFNITQYNQGNLNAGVTETPESDDGAFLTLKNMIDWKNQKMPNAKVNVTEFGWNAGVSGDGCGPLGESTQAAYYLRGYLLAARYDIHRAFAYAYTDQSEYPLYCTTGLFKDITNNIPRKVYRSIQTVVNSSLKNMRFLKALSENTSQSSNGLNGKFVYLFGDSAGTPTHMIAWKPAKLGYEDSNYPALSSTYDTITLPSPNILAYQNDPYYYTSWDNSQNGTISNSLSGTVNISGSTSNVVYAKLSGMPIVIPIHAGNCKYDPAGILINCGANSVDNYTNNTYSMNIFYASGNLNINSLNLEANITLKVFNAMGQEVLSKNVFVSASSTLVEFDPASKGIYIARITTKEGFVFTKKLSVN